MPCRSDYPEPTEAELNARGKMVLTQLEAVLCGVLSVDETVVDRVDWEEVGVSKETALKWWRKHQQEDDERRKREEIIASRNRLAEEARAKLTPDEIEAIRLSFKGLVR